MSFGTPAAQARGLRRIEARSLQRDAAHGADAQRRWEALASPSQRMALVREIVSTRASELTLAYGNVVAVVAGYKARRDAQGAEQLHPEPCVIFMVKRKWMPGDRLPDDRPPDETVDPRQQLPPHLLCYGPDPAQPARKAARCLYAVPTDVQLAARHIGARTQAHGAIRVTDDEQRFALPGTLTCGVRLRGAAMAESCFALSAMHVLSPVPKQTDAQGGANYTAISAADDIKGVSAGWGGHIDADLGDGFDAQLTEIRDRRWFNAAFAPLKLSARQPFVAAPDLFDELAPTHSFWIVVHEHQPNAPPGARGVVQAQFSKIVGPAWPVIYDVWHGGKATPVGIAHPELLVLAVQADCAPPVNGDSGAAVVCATDDGRVTLVGMYIAQGPPGAERDAYVLPAWQLFDPANWRHLPEGTVALHPTFSLP